MYGETYQAVSSAAKNKVNFLKKSPVGYFIHSMLAGAYIGFGNILINVIGGLMKGAPATKVVMGCAFGIALSLVVIAGAELFTGNTLVMTAGLTEKKISFADALKLLVLCWFGNLAGSALLAVFFHFSGLYTEPAQIFLATAAAGKMSAPFLQLVIRGILCNILVCLAVWCGFKCRSESAKLIMIFWCLFAFITCGFEHSIANMTQLTLALLDPAGQAVSFGGWLHNLLAVTIGNIIGGVCFVALPYFVGAKAEK
ncbi:MAG: formate/nitrite transporter family protein [Lachnospiraceae bacterium]|nr:formate/nitrite transporter family protein [Lachnospiraceae bacterium]MDD6449399.1 formate/nitrite transporter family protein [Lachnospiraceae bacterium]MDD6450530.1 formate/nitrite transporter family protein [Lachnospiraceae bacterium]MDD6578593.1 formate/nitrite transporter family protein [Lachnospiraceae bacterium]